MDKFLEVLEFQAKNLSWPQDFFVPVFFLTILK